MVRPVHPAARAASALARATPREDRTDRSTCLVDLCSTPGGVARLLAGIDWDFPTSRSDEYSHALHPYPARFVPLLPRNALAALSRPRELVLDPFSGGGTTAVEALALGRTSYAIDANEVGNAIGRAKTSRLGAADLRALQRLEAALLKLDERELRRRRPEWLPEIPNIGKWYDPSVFDGLGVVRSLVTGVEAEAARTLALVSFVQAATRLSYQDSETRYASRPRRVEVLEVPRAVLSELRRMKAVAERIPADSGGEATFIDGDARDPASYAGVAPQSVSLIVTSPPYPNTYDYHLYHRFRLFWLGANPAELRRVEIGSHLKNQSAAAPEAAYLNDMRAALQNCFHALAPGRWMVMVVGDGLFKGETFRTAEHLGRVAEDIGFDSFGAVNRALPTERRSITRPGRRLISEQVMLLRRPPDGRRGSVVDPNYEPFPYERELQLRELHTLGGSPRVTGDRNVAVVPVPELRRAAFIHGVRKPSGKVEPSIQKQLEGAPGSNRRKNSTYAAHGIHRYKGKFYPQLAKALMNLSGVEPGLSLVADPFGGSGTVAAEAMVNGIDALSIDCNPVATAIARAKIAAISSEPRVFKAGCSRIAARISTAPSRPTAEALSAFTPETLPELERWLPSPVLAKLGVLLSIIREEPRAKLVSVLEVLVSSIIREISQQEPKDLRIRRRATPISDAPVYELFLERLDSALVRLAAFWRHAPMLGSPGEARVVLGNSATRSAFESVAELQIDAVVSSPPYAAALPYLDTDRLSLAAVFGIAPPKRKDLEDTMIGSREITNRAREHYAAALRNRSPDGLPASTLDFLNAYQTAVESDESAGFRRQQAPAVLLRYFCSMSDVLANLHAHMKLGSPCWFVLGDSRSTIGGRRWTIPTVDEVAAIGEHRGFCVVERLPITVTREDVLHSRHSITRNIILHFEKETARPSQTDVVPAHRLTEAN